MKLELGAIFEIQTWPDRGVLADPNPSTCRELMRFWEGHLSWLDNYLSQRMPEEEKT